MEISFKKALCTPFNDENWMSKIGIGVLLFVPALLTSFAFGEKNWTASLLTFIAGFFIGGYYWFVLNYELNDVEDILPEWDFIKIAYIAVQGFIIALGYGLISLPVVAVFAALIFILKPLSMIFIILGILVAVCWYLILIPIAQTLFAKDFEFSEAFNFSKVYNIAKNSWQYYLLAILYSLLIGLIFGFSFGVISGILGVFSKPLSIFILNISQLLVGIASANLYGQTFKKAMESIGQTPEA